MVDQAELRLRAWLLVVSHIGGGLLEWPLLPSKTLCVEYGLPWRNTIYMQCETELCSLMIRDRDRYHYHIQKVYGKTPLRPIWKCVGHR